MTEFQYLDEGNTEAKDRLATSYLFAQGSVGLANDGVLADLAVAQTGTASAAVLVNSGACVVQDTVGNGVALLVSDTQKTLDILTANPMGGTPRNDIVVFDSVTKTIHAIIGTPNASPTDPTVPNTALALARVRNLASATTIPTAQIDDYRVFTGLAATDTGWISLSTAGFSGTVVDVVKYRKVNGVVYMQGNVRSFTSGSFQTLCTLPVGARPTVVGTFGASSNTAANMVISVATTGVVTVWCDATTAAFTGLANITFPVG